MDQPSRKMCITQRMGSYTQTDHAIVWEYNHITKKWEKDERPADFGVRPQSVLRATHESD